MHDALVIALGTPVLVGVYKEGCLIEEIRERVAEEEKIDLELELHIIGEGAVDD